MNKDVLIHVRGLQMMETDDAQEPIEIVVPGQYYFRNGSHYLRYEEMLDDTAETTVNYIKMSPNGVEVRKQGQVNVHMVFEEGKKNKTFYNTPYGTLQMGISATGLELKESEDGIQMIHAILRAEAKRGKLIVITSHHQEDITALCDHVYRIKEGGLVDET